MGYDDDDWVGEPPEGRHSRERANLAKREPQRLAELRAKYAAWERSIPALPPDAAFSIPYTRADLAHPS